MERGALDAYWIRSAVPGVGTRYRVRVGRFAYHAGAQANGERLRSQGMVQEFFVAKYVAPSEPAVAKAMPPAETLTRGARALESVGSEVVAGPTGAALPGKRAPARTRASGEPPEAGVPAFVTFEDKALGYALDHPIDWRGSAWTDAERRSQSADGGASFKSKDGSAFCNVIWNSLPDANESEKFDNAEIVDKILAGMTSGADSISVSELSRSVESDDSQIKTYLDLNADFRDAAGTASVRLLGKALIARGQQGILLVVVFYASDASLVAATNAERILHSVRAPP